MAKLKRNISTPLLTFYGLGTIIGAGIYVLIGKVTVVSGSFTPIAFLVASFVAGFSALSYAELSARFPYSAGEMVYIHNAFNLRPLSIVIGWLVVLTGIVSAATIISGFSGYLQEFINISDYMSIVLLTLVLTTIAIWGIFQSVTIVSIITIIGIMGLLFVIANSGINFSEVDFSSINILPSFNISDWSVIFLGSFLAFYAFIGFEDMVNIAEEVKRPEKSFPIAIIMALAIATLLYLAIAVISILKVPPEILGKSKAPLATILADSGAIPIKIISIVSLISITNGALVQIIMASRVIYGMAKNKMAFHIFSKVNKYTQTPIHSTISVGSLVLIFSLCFSLVNLAKVTSFIVLFIFFIVNSALIALKSKKAKVKHSISYHIGIPITGAFLSLALIIFQIISIIS